jgi:hypothetical protein
MHLPSSATASTANSSRAPWLLAVALLLALALGLHGPIAQWASYHAFADTRAWLGLPNAENVLSNLPFALIGAWALGWLAQPGSMVANRLAWCAFAAALVCTACGSALYHWAPGNGALVFDRLPIAWACAALLCAFLADRVNARWAAWPVLTAALLAASASVAWWWLGERHGQGDLRPYLYVQFLSMLLVPAAIWLTLPAQDPRALGNDAWWAVLGLYAAAKGMELADQTIFDALGFTSGHTLKHLLAATAALVLLRAVRVRQ